MKHSQIFMKIRVTPKEGTNKKKMLQNCTKMTVLFYYLIIHSFEVSESERIVEGTWYTDNYGVGNPEKIFKGSKMGKIGQNCQKCQKCQKWQTLQFSANTFFTIYQSFLKLLKKEVEFVFPWFTCMLPQDTSQQRSKIVKNGTKRLKISKWQF